MGIHKALACQSVNVWCGGKTIAVTACKPGAVVLTGYPENIGKLVGYSGTTNKEVQQLQQFLTPDSC
jgi:hypothetical protein